MHRTGTDGELPVAGKAYGVVLVGAKSKLVNGVVLGGEDTLCYNAGFFKGQQGSVNRRESVLLFGTIAEKLVIYFSSG